MFEQNDKIKLIEMLFTIGLKALWPIMGFRDYFSIQNDIKQRIIYIKHKL